MKIAILGAGFAGLAAAYHLTKKGHEVIVFEKEDKPGGLAVGFKEKDWQWSLEKHYHHFFTNDYELINLAKDLGLSSSIIFPPSTTSIYAYSHAYTPGVNAGLHPRKRTDDQIYPFNTPWDILTFKPLNFLNRLRLGLVTLFLKLLPESIGKRLEKYTAWQFCQKFYGQKAFEIVWEPLLISKFGDHASQVNASWFWARIKKRTLKLGYIQGGFQILADALARKIEEQGGRTLFNTEVEQVSFINNKWVINLEKHAQSFQKNKNLSSGTFDAVISTLPAPSFLKIFASLRTLHIATATSNIHTSLPIFYQQLSTIPHLHVLTLILITNQPFLKDTYWLNIADSTFPFLCLVQHTNFMDKKYYGEKHILYISNYLPENHPYFKKSARQLLKIYEPYLKKINPSFHLLASSFQLRLFTGPFAQPVFLPHYSKIRPFGQILPKLYLANLDSVYPWDRGTNYALEIGRKVAEMIGKS